MAFARHVTLTAATVATTTLTGHDYGSVEVVNVTGTAPVYLSYDGSAAPPNPAVAGNDFDVLPAAAGATTTIHRTSAAAMVVKAISAGTPSIAYRAVG